MLFQLQLLYARDIISQWCGLEGVNRKGRTGQMKRACDECLKEFVQLVKKEILSRSGCRMCILSSAELRISAFPLVTLLITFELKFGVIWEERE